MRKLTLYEQAEARLSELPEAVREFALDESFQAGDGDEHLRWVLAASDAEILAWAEHGMEAAK
jgi:hypothetical protein